MALLSSVPRRLSIAVLVASSLLLAAATVVFYPAVLYLTSSSSIDTSLLLLSTSADSHTFHSLPAAVAEVAGNTDSDSDSSGDGTRSGGSGGSSGIIDSSVSCALFPAATGGTTLLVPIDSRITSTGQLGLPSSEVLWDEESVSCPALPQPLMEPPFESFCAAHRSSSPIPPSYEWTVTGGPVGKPGFLHLCYDRTHSGGALLTLTDAFAGPHGFIYNSTHAVTMNPWYEQRYSGESRPKRADHSGARTVVCYEELVWAHSIFDDEVGPHTLLEVAPILSHLLDSTPPHVPIVLRYTPHLRAAYDSLHLNSDRFVAYDPSVLYHSRRMWWFRRPEEYTHTYWRSIRRRLFKQPLQPLPPLSADYRPVIVYLHRLKSHRSVTNADELVNSLNAAFPASSYDVVVFNGSLSLSQSAALFSRTSLVVGPHGGAFLNSMFLPPLSSVVEIAYPDSTNSMPFPPYYYLMSCGLRLFHHIVVAEQGRYDSPMTLNLTRLLDTMQRALAMQWSEGGRESESETSGGTIGKLLLEGEMAAEESGSLDDVSE